MPEKATKHYQQRVRKVSRQGYKGFTPAGKKIGRPIKRPPANAVDVVRDLAGEGHALIGIARVLGTSADTLRRWFDEDEELKAALDEGREKERYSLHNVLYKAATEQSNTTAAMFLLKSRHGYREGDSSETANRVSINFTLPGAMPLNDFVQAESVRDLSIQTIPTTRGNNHE
ncbi:MAG: hypothetical protein Q7W55_10945 [Pseudohongiella sp.]|nr:hypothetical protein [Pseudohongiella sp.]